MKQVVVTMHDSIIAAWVKQAHNANCKCHTMPFEIGNLVYILLKNLKIPCRLACKLILKFIGPYWIT